MALEQILFDGVNPVVKLVNGWFTLVFPGKEVYFVVGIALLLGYFMKKKYGMKYFGFLMMVFMIYITLRYFGFGG